ncbi:MAG: outer membrane protein assembly factor BamD [Pseudomonadota bacterium]
MRFVFIILIALLFGCQSSKEVTFAESTPEVLYLSGIKAVENKDPQGAIAYFERIELEFPHSTWLEHAKIMQIFCYFVQADYIVARLQADSFTSTHPANSDLAYVYYIRALCDYERIFSAQNDQTQTVEAQYSLNDVITLFPDSVYTSDAKLKLGLVYDHLAGQEMEVGRFYLKKGNLPAAAQRFQFVIDNYQTTPQLPESLYRMSEIMINYGLPQDATRYYSILSYNYPQHIWTERAASLIKEHN